MHATTRRQLNSQTLRLLVALWVIVVCTGQSRGAQSDEFDWAFRAGGDSYEYGAQIAVDNDGNSYVAGTFQSATIVLGSTTLTNSGGCNVFVLKCDLSGHVLWARGLGGVGGSACVSSHCITADSFGNSHVLGFENGGGFTGAFIVKFDPNGNVLWRTNILGGGGSLGGLALDHAGNVCVFNGSFVSKYSSTGALVWSKAIVSGDFFPRGFGADGSGNFYLIGFAGCSTTIGGIIVTNAETGDGSFIAKCDIEGNGVWAKHLGAVPGVDIESFAVDESGNTYLTGQLELNTFTFGSTTLTNANSSQGGRVIFALKYDSSGNPAWANQASSGGSGNIGTGIAGDAHGNCFVTGILNNSQTTFDSVTLTKVGITDVFIAKYNSSGQLLWVTRTGERDELTGYLARLSHGEGRRGGFARS